MPQVNLHTPSSSLAAQTGGTKQTTSLDTNPTNLAHSPATSYRNSIDLPSGISSHDLLRNSLNHSKNANGNKDLPKDDHNSDDSGFDDWDDPEFEDSDMPSDLRPSLSRHNDGRSQTPLLNPKESNGYGQPIRPGVQKRRSTFREHDSDAEARQATRKRYTYAAFFLVLSLISFTIQTETAVYIKKYLGWKKSYAML